MIHKFYLGQAVEYHRPRGIYAPRGAYIVTAKLPERDGRFGRTTQARSSPRRIDIKPDPVAVVQTLLAESALCEVGDADGRATLMRRRRRVLIRDVVLAIVIALVLFGAWKLIALAFALEVP